MMKGRKGSGGPSCLVEECELEFSNAEQASTGEMGRKGGSKRAGRSGYAR
jgi:hypothetical protein